MKLELIDMMYFLVVYDILGFYYLSLFRGFQ